MDIKELAKIISDQNAVLFAFTYGVIFIHSKLSTFIYFIMWLLFGLFYEFARKIAFKSKSPVIGEVFNREVGWIWVIGIFLVGFILLNIVNAPKIAIQYTLAMLICFFVAMVVVPFWTISGHALGIVATLVTLWYLGVISPLVAIIIYVIFGWSRLTLGAHTPAQYLAGGLVSFIVTYLLLTGI